MHKDINCITLVGRLVRDPEPQYTSEGVFVLKCSLAYTRAICKNGEWSNKSCFVDFSLWDKRAEFLGQYLKKGIQLCISGELDYYTYVSNGKSIGKHSIVIKDIEMLGKKELNKVSGEDYIPF